MRVVFCGTGAFGEPALRALTAAGIAVTAVVTQPDRPAGRRRELKPSPIKLAATELGLPVFQPERINAPEAHERLKSEAPDVLMVVAYGQILRRATLALPRVGCVNLHGSLLPRHRGASPIAAALAAGDATTGVTAMVMDEGLDTGPILAQAEVPVRPDDDAATLHDRVAAAGGAILVPTLRAFVAGDLLPRPQDDAAATVCRTLTREDARIDWSSDAAAVERRIRAYRPWPGAWTTAPGAVGVPFDLGVTAAEVAPDGAPAPAGVVVEAEGDRLVVACGSGRIRLVKVKPAGKAEMDAGAFLRGRRLAAGVRLG